MNADRCHSVFASLRSARKTFAWRVAAIVVTAGTAASAAAPAPVTEKFAVDAPQSLAYQVAMARYESILRTTPVRKAAVFVVPVEQGYRWTWTTSTTRLQRAGEGAFLISFDDCLSGFCRQVRCEDAGWPSFDCSDGKQRTMSVSDASTVVFDGVSYTRVTPLPQ